MKSNQLSQTAAFVAIKFFGLTQIDSFRSIFDDSVIQFYENLLDSLPAPFRFYRYWLKFGWVRAFYIWGEELLLPGDLLHVVARKWYIQQMTQQFVEEGYKQIIVLGAGFDHLAYYYANRGVSCFEFDTPYMTVLKRNFFIRNYPGQHHPRIVQAFLPKDKIRDLLPRHIDPEKKTLIIAEGFFDYLEAETVEQSLADINNFFSHKPALISTHFALDELPYFYQKVFEISVKLVGEKLQFHTPMKELKFILRKHGFKISQLYDSEDIRANLSEKLSTGLPVLGGFYVFSAIDESISAKNPPLNSP